jgi:two-component system response regulator CpxR
MENAEPIRILIVDDDRELTTMLGEYLAREGFVVEVCHDGSEAVALLAAGTTCSLVVLDVMLPGTNGLDVLRSLRAQQSTPPVLMLTARGDDIDRIVGLELGADDYLPKPFNPRELVARLRAILRRAADRPAVADEVVYIPPIRLDTPRHTVKVRDTIVVLTGAEFRVLEVLMRSVGRVVSREQLTEQALGRPLELYDRSVDTHVSNLRRKLALVPPVDPEIRGIRGAGYLLTQPGAA